ncbi:unnamed protein product, partial [Amoebophrya sp. A120]
GAGPASRAEEVEPSSNNSAKKAVDVDLSFLAPRKRSSVQEVEDELDNFIVPARRPDPDAGGGSSTSKAKPKANTS